MNSIALRRRVVLYMSRMLIVLACVSGLGVWGCDLDESTKDKCEASSDCLVGRVCENGRCKLRDCSSNADCEAPAGLCDESGRCVQCLSGSDCEGEQACEDGFCSGAICQTDGQCERGQICEGGDCLDGCRSERDCWDGWQCVDDMGAHGTCVECLVERDCPEGKTCDENRCTTYCTLDQHCTPQVCDTENHVCVDCLEDGDCATQGQICDSNQCLAGCRDDEDCPEGRCKDSTRCVACLSDNDCPAGTICVGEDCVTGCASSRDCPAELLCDDDLGPHGTCVECLGDGDCDQGSSCRDGSCESACASDQDCEAPLPACDPVDRTCVACVNDAHCGQGTICVDNACQPGCQNDGDCPGDKVCDAGQGDYGACVDCRDNDDCGADQICQYGQCVVVGREMIRIQGGTFFRGSDPGEGDGDEEPEKTISLPTFYIDRTEVTNAQFRDCVVAGHCSEPVETTAYNDPTRSNHPVVYVSWQQAMDYCEWQGKTLPTEARWERAARGITPSEKTYPWGDSAPDCAKAEFYGCTGATAAVGSHLPGATAEGVLDMAGNVSEWVYDYYDRDYYSNSLDDDDPTGPASGSTRVVRGGAYDSLPEQIRCANRTNYPPEQVSPNRGFRCSNEGGPTAALSVDPMIGPYNDYFTADASACTDPNYSSDVLEVRWDWGDIGLPTEWSREKTNAHRYLYPGIFTVELEVRNPDGYTASANEKIVAEGAWGWDGTECSSSNECAHGFVCVRATDAADFRCRQDCSMADLWCYLDGYACTLSEGAAGEFPLKMACISQ